MELTPAELTVLGLVVEKPQHGYDLERVIEQRGIRQWTPIGFSSIYYLLDKLAKQDLIEAVDPGAGPKARRVFRSTEYGHEAARQGILALITDARDVPRPFLVALANLPLLSASEYAEALHKRLAQLDERIAAVTAAAHAQAPLPPPAREVFSYSLGLMEAERSWLAERVQVRR